MSKFNDIDLKKWKQYTDIDVGSLWIIDKRKKDDLNSNNYHGNFVPQIPEHFVKRFTKENDLIIDPFVGSGTTIFEASRNKRYSIGIDLNKKLFELVNCKNIDRSLYSLIAGDSQKKTTIKKIVNEMTNKYNRDKAQFIIFHPPYHDIIKFSDKKEDLSNCVNIKEFLNKFKKVVVNYRDILEDDRYCALVVGDKYQDSEWIPLSFYCMNIFLECGFTLKGTIIKNSVNTKAKAGNDNIWRYRALASDYYIFKHEYIFVFKKKRVKVLKR